MRDKKSLEFLELILYSALAGALYGSFVTNLYKNRQIKEIRENASRVTARIQAVFTDPYQKDRYYREIREYAENAGIKNYVDKVVLGAMNDYFSGKNYPDIKKLE